jgi:hypothetical protein
MPKPAAARGADDALLDEALEESFPASDPLSFWSGRDSAGRTESIAEPGPEAGQEAGPEAAEEAVPEAGPEADDLTTVRAWEETEAMDGPAPTG